MSFIEQLTYAREHNKQPSTVVATSKPIKQQMSMLQYQANIIALALRKLKQQKDNI